MEMNQTVGGSMYDISGHLRILQRNYTYMNEMKLIFWIILSVILSWRIFVFPYRGL